MPGKIFDVLNEIVVDRGSNPYLSKIECYEHDRLITKVKPIIHFAEVVLNSFSGLHQLCYMLPQNIYFNKCNNHLARTQNFAHLV